MIEDVTTATGATLLRRGDGDAGKASMAVGRATAVIARNVGMEKCILLLLRSWCGGWCGG